MHVSITQGRAEYIYCVIFFEGKIDAEQGTEERTQTSIQDSCKHYTLHDKSRPVDKPKIHMASADSSVDCRAPK